MALSVQREVKIRKVAAVLYGAFLILSGCTTITKNKNSILIREVDRPLQELRMIASEILPAGQRAVSPNGRELLSRHFILDGSTGYKPAADATDRFYAKILLLGDRRPYDIEILVTREKRVLRGSQFTYVIAGFDPRLAKELETTLRNELSKRREDRNIIDDFRVY